MLPIERRIAALEELPHKVDTSHNQAFAAAIKALFDAVSTRCEWAPSKVAPFLHVEQPSPLARLWERIKAETLTGDDRAMLDSLPACHIPPEKLVECVLKLQGRI